LANPTIIVHGGAGDWPKNKHAIGLAGVRKAATRGFRILRQGRSAIQAVEAAVIEMEDNPIFNARKGLGIVSLDRKGRYGIAHNTPHLCWAALTEDEGLVSQMVGSR
jgi:isoaspartyl peptidase/L-asparaginase-like protein (Ntn-hydrolase superfamily)